MSNTILIVDDSAVARMALKVLFDKYYPFIKILLAENTAQTIKILKEQEVNLISIDYNMPDQNGLELGMQIRQSNIKTPIVILTANIQNALKEKATEQGFDFIEKPITEKTLQQIISYIKG